MNQIKYLAMIFLVFCAAAPRAWATRRFDVIVVGAGPTGLAIAIGAAQRGLSVLVLEKREVLPGDVPGEWGSRTRVIGLQDRTYAKLVEMGAKLPEGKVVSLEAHNFRGELVHPDLKTFQDAGLVKNIHIQVGPLENALGDLARTLPIEFVFGAVGTKFQSNRRVSYRVGEQNFEAEFTWAALAVGSDTSDYTEMFGPRIKNKDVKAIPMISADFRVNESVGGFDILMTDDPEPTVDAVALTTNGVTSLSVIEPHATRGKSYEEFLPKANAHLAKVLGQFRLSGPQITKPMRFDLGQDHITEVYRDGVFVLGDAARRTSPTTGMGVNLGIKDAIAFAEFMGSWKKDHAVAERGTAWLKGVIESNSQVSAKKSQSIQDVLKRESSNFFKTCVDIVQGVGGAEPQTN